MKTPTGLTAKGSVLLSHRADNSALTRRISRAVAKTWLPAALACVAMACPLLAAESEIVAYERGELGLHHRVWNKVARKSDPATGKTIQATNVAYVELAAGLNYLENGGLKESKAEFEISAEGYAVARRGQHQVTVSGLLTDARGAVDMKTPDGKRLRSTLRGLYLYNRRTGQSLLVAEANPGAVGNLVAPNEVLFTNAFAGFGANVRYRYGLGNFHQDVLLTERLNLKELQAAGFPAEVTTLEIWTEFLEAPEVQVRSRKIRGETDAQLRAEMVEPDVYDDALDFGVMKMPMGKAFMEHQKSTGPESLRVNKRWVEMEGRRFLIESIPLDRAGALLAQLPGGQSNEDLLKGKSLYAARRAPSPLEAGKPSRSIQLAGLELRNRLAYHPQFVIDYETVIGNDTDFTFESDTTYYLSGSFYPEGNVTFEGGTVLKYAPGATINFDGSFTGNNIYTKTGPYRPAIFTSKDDDSVGFKLPNSSGIPTITALTYYLSTDRIKSPAGSPLKYLHMRYAYVACDLFGDYPNTLALDNCTFVNCGVGLWVESGTLRLRNVLFANCSTAVSFYNLYPEWNSFNLEAQNITVDQGQFIELNDWGEYPGATVKLVNSLLTRLTVPISNPNSYGLIKLASHELATSPFVTVGAGSYYLPSGSPYRDAGITHIAVGPRQIPVIDPELLADLRTKTTAPPADRASMAISEETVWPIFASRDDGLLDLGYHYPALDYLAQSVTVNNASLLLSDGVALAGYGAEGIVLEDNGNLIIQGTRCTPNHICTYQTVQEQPMILASAEPDSMKTISSDVTSSPGLLQARYTHFHGLPDMAGIVNVDNVALDMRNCEVYSGSVTCETLSYPQRVDVINNLFERVALTFDYGGGLLAFHNNTAINSAITFNGSSFDTWPVRDNLFDHCTVTASPVNEGGVSSGNNAHRTWIGSVPVGFVSTELTADVLYAAGPSGDRYINPSYSELSSLVNAGSRSAAAAGLSAYTILSNETQDTDLVDIDHHYPVAMQNLSGGAFWTDSVASADEMARAIMAGTGATVVPGSAKYTGADVASGFFGNGNSVGLNGHVFPIDHGVILSSGDIDLAHGPNNDWKAEGLNFPETHPSTSADSDLNKLVEGLDTFDAAVLEFRIDVADTLILSFSYIFASEEYPEYVSSQWNDLIGIFVAADSDFEAQDNIVFVPGTSLPVAVNNVNGGLSVNVPAENPDYYVDNKDPSTEWSSQPDYAAEEPVFYLQYDGFTMETESTDHDPLTASIQLSAGTYFIKIAIADASDNKWDSAVFISAQATCP